MRERHHIDDRPTWDWFPPAFYKLLVGCLVWFLVAAIGFGVGGYLGLALAVAAVFSTIVGLLGFGALRIARRDSPGQELPPRHFLNGRFRSHTETTASRAALVMALLPIASVAIGLTLFAIIWMAVG
ncbi:hypothetical protein KXR53_28610 [Inquilinus limosus]|uniref:hypothetical protein n=1 Tax=Inquilinus limosus TaxID=171674 RepID=UPI003F13E6AB